MNISKRKITNLLFIALLSISLSCSKEENDDLLLEINPSELTMSRVASEQTVAVTTNLSNISCSSNELWCIANYSDGNINVTTTTNEQSSSRNAQITISAENITRTISISQLGYDSYANNIKDNLKISASGAETSSFQSGTGIELTIDGDYSTIYHSKWNNSASNYFPITMTYNFTDIAAIDYLIYYPRQEGTNGFIKELELWVATETDTELTKYGEYNFNGNSSPSKISFPSSLIKPTSIKFIVKSGSGDDQGFVSCAEMEFYQNNPENFDFSTIFTDNSCSEIKSGVTEENIMAIPNNFYRDLALEIYNNTYESEFRVQEYAAFQDPNIMAAINKTSPYSLRDNPTGISVHAGEELIFFANKPSGENISILIQDLNNGFGGNTYAVFDGLNKINVSSGGLVYVMYQSNETSADDVKINFATGDVNGYFDSRKHNSTDWSRLLNAAVSDHFDVIGEFAHLTFPTANFKDNTPDGLALIDKYDNLVQLEWEFMGLYKYNKTFKNHMYFHVIYTDDYMYATSNRTAYSEGTMDYMTSLSEFSSSPWGPAHEVGHCNQTRPGLKWIGMTEVTTNIYSLHVQTSWGNKSRLVDEGKYANAIAEIVTPKIAHNEAKDVFNKLVPFWQLKLYLIDALGKKDFYKDLHEYVRNKDYSDVVNEGFYQLDFVRATCQIANLDLTTFFEQWGFLTPIDMEISDYSTKQFTITQEEIDALKAEIAAKEYQKPNHSDIYKITDDNVASYK
ncbi:MAG: M60 family metallopeptidase [Mangrovibacterium sp.]